MRHRRWWEVPADQQRQGRQGRLALAKGRDVEISCPECGEFPIVYSGNYFCDNWNYPVNDGDCSWALPHPAVKKRDREICDLIGIDYD